MQSGYLLRNRYRIENRLSAGGFGETYIAVDEDYPNKRRVVVKHLKPQSNDPMVLQMARRLFNDEGETLANLGEKTDRIPTLYAYFEENKEFYLVQELIEGQTLTQELGTRRLSEAEMLEVVREILVALTEVHIERIVHPDLKPDNIIRRSRVGGASLQENRKLILIDFGAVKKVRQTTLNPSNATQSIGVGTAGYMPTEQAIGYPTSASDIYAVGAIALQCLTGKPPSELFDENDLAFKWQHLCSVSDRVMNILSKMVAARHLDRYANAMETIKAIELFVAPVAPVPMPTIPSPAPTPQPISQPSQATSLNPSLTTIKVPVQTPQPPARKKIDRRKLIKWATLVGCVSIGLLVWSTLNKKSKPLRITTTAVGRTPPNSYNTSVTQKYKEEDILALADYNRKIQRNPNDAKAYFNRGFLKKTKIQDNRGALADYDRAIQLNPNFDLAYGNRGLLKADKFQDYRGALTDYNLAVSINPNYAKAYCNRGILKVNNLHDYQGSLVDYNWAIKLNSNYANAYYNRGLLKAQKLNDRSGAINDMKQAATLYQQKGSQKDYQDAIAQLKKWGGS